MARTARVLAFVKGMVDQELWGIEYLAAENHLLKAQLKGRLKLSDHVARDHVMYVLLSLTCRAALPAQLEWRILAQARKDVRRRLVEPEAGRIR